MPARSHVQPIRSASTVTISFEAERDGDDSSFAIDNVALVALGG
jgi:hypothetical protein